MQLIRFVKEILQQQDLDEQSQQQLVDFLNRQTHVLTRRIPGAPK